MEDYIDKEYYMTKFNPEAVNKFWDLCGDIEEHIEDKEWDLTRKNNKRYVAFYDGYPIVFGVHFHSNNRFHIFFKATPDMINNIEIPGFEFVYGKHPKQLMYYFPASEDIDLDLFDEHFEAAYENITRKNK